MRIKKAMSILLAVLAFCCVNTALGVTWNVPGDSATIQGGIDLASYGDTVQVAANTYVENITLKNGVALIGAGAATTTIDGNAAGSVVTSTSCDPNTVFDGFTITNGDANSGGGMYNAGGGPTVMNCSFSGNTSTWGGGGMYNGGGSVTVTNCTFTDNTGIESGGGMYNSGGSPKVSGCTFSGNRTGWNLGFGAGGGMYNNGSLTLINCDFNGNVAEKSPHVTLSGLGGGIYNSGSNVVNIRDCTFSGNYAAYGAGMYNINSSPAITGCSFIRNLVTQSGGGAGMQNRGSSPTVSNCTFSGNTGFDFWTPNGGGIFNTLSSNPNVINCAFIGNRALFAGGIFSGESCAPTITNCTFSANVGEFVSPGAITGGSPVVTNCILWNNTPGEILIGGGTVSYSDVKGGHAGTENISADPLFVGNPSSGLDGVWGTADDDYGDLHLSLGSPCIDKGSNAGVPSGITTDLEGYQRIIDGDCNDTEVVDMGAYEFNYAYMGDVDYSCGVDLSDFSVFARAWETHEGDAGWNRACDISNPPDDYIDLNDLLILCNNWLAVMP